tara:strand:- start:3931 stop:7116 length:3186 start_codon:yes stop_codon:yes gene_type:complete
MIEKNLIGKSMKMAAEGKQYKDLPWQHSPGLPVVDFLYEKPFYGKIDRKVNAIQLKESNLKQLTSDRSTLLAANFVADAFEAMQKYYKKALVNSSIYSSGRLVTLQPLKAWSSLTSHYRNHLESLYEEFILEYVPFYGLENNITTFDKFMEVFMQFVAHITPDVPITKTAFSCSRYCPIHVSGLVIELDVEDMEHGKFSRNSSLLEDPNFDFYRTTAKKYGFYVSKNAPWCLVANINSRGQGTATNSVTGEVTSFTNGMARYMGEYGIDRENVFERLYYKTHLGFVYDDHSGSDIHLLRYYLLQFYSSFVDNDPFYTKSTPCNTWAKFGTKYIDNLSSNTKVITREPIGHIDSDGRMPPTYLAKYDFFYWLEKYITIRLAEQDVNLSGQKMFNMAKKIKHSCGATKAIDYVNENVKGFKRTEYLLNGKFWQGDFDSLGEKVFRNPALTHDKFATSCLEPSDKWMAKINQIDEQIAAALTTQGYVAPQPMYKNTQHHLYNSLQVQATCASPCQCPQGTEWNAAMGVCLSIAQDPGSTKSFLDPCEQDPTAEGCLPPPEEDHHEDPREDWMKVYADCVKECVASGKKYNWCQSQCEQHKPWHMRKGDAGKCPDNRVWQQTGPNSGKCVPPPPPAAEAEPGVPAYTIEELERGCEEGWITDPDLCAQIEDPPPAASSICESRCDDPLWAEYNPEKCTGCPPPPVPEPLWCGPGHYYNAAEHRCVPIGKPKPKQINCPDGWTPSVHAADGRAICLPPDGTVVSSSRLKEQDNKEDLQIATAAEEQACPEGTYKDANGVCQPIQVQCPEGYMWDTFNQKCRPSPASVAAAGEALAAEWAAEAAEAEAAKQKAFVEKIAAIMSATSTPPASDPAAAAAAAAQATAAAIVAELIEAGYDCPEGDMDCWQAAYVSHNVEAETEEQDYYHSPCDDVIYKMNHPEECGSPGAMGGNPVAGVPGANASTGPSSAASSTNLAELKESCGQLVWSDERGEYTCSETGEAAPAELVEAETDGVVEPEDEPCPYPGQIKDPATNECKCPPGHKLNNLTLKCEKDDNDDDVITMINF